MEEATKREEEGVIAMEAGNYAKAISLFEEAIKLKQAVLGTNTCHIAYDWTKQAEALIGNGSYTAAIQNLNKALEVQIKNLGEKHKSVGYTMIILSLAYFTNGEYKKATEWLNKGIKIIEEMENGRESWYYAKALSLKGFILLLEVEDGVKSEILEQFTKSQEIRKSLFGELHKHTASGYSALGSYYFLNNDLEAAYQNYNLCLNIQIKVLGIEGEGERHLMTCITYSNLASVEIERSEWRKAQEYQEKALSLESQGEESMITPDSVIPTKDKGSEREKFFARAHYNLGRIYFAIGDLLALSELEKALSMRRECFGEGVEVAVCSKTLGEAYLKVGENVKAKDIFTMVVDIYTTYFGEDDKVTQEVSQLITQC